MNKTLLCLLQNLIEQTLFVFIFLQFTKLRSQQNLWLLDRAFWPHLWLDMPTNLLIRFTLSLECWKINITYNIIFEILTSRFDNYQIAICDTLDLMQPVYFNIFIVYGQCFKPKLYNKVSLLLLRPICELCLPHKCRE